jgi:hypothetical protein
MSCMQVFELLARCMSEDPEKRPQAAEVARELQRILDPGEFAVGQHAPNKSRSLAPGSEVCFIRAASDLILIAPSQLQLT